MHGLKHGDEMTLTVETTVPVRATYRGVNEDGQHAFVIHRQSVQVDGSTMLYGSSDLPTLDYSTHVPAPVAADARGQRLRSDDLQAGDEMRDEDGSLVYTLAARLRDQEKGNVVWRVRWVDSQGGGYTNRAWERGALTSLRRPSAQEG